MFKEESYVTHKAEGSTLQTSRIYVVEASGASGKNRCCGTWTQILCAWPRNLFLDPCTNRLQNAAHARSRQEVCSIPFPKSSRIDWATNMTTIPILKRSYWAKAHGFKRRLAGLIPLQECICTSATHIVTTQKLDFLRTTISRHCYSGTFVAFTQKVISIFAASFLVVVQNVTCSNLAIAEFYYASPLQHRQSLSDYQFYRCNCVEDVALNGSWSQKIRSPP